MKCLPVPLGRYQKEKQNNAGQERMEAENVFAP